MREPCVRCGRGSYLDFAAVHRRLREVKAAYDRAGLIRVDHPVESAHR